MDHTRPIIPSDTEAPEIIVPPAARNTKPRPQFYASWDTNAGMKITDIQGRNNVLSRFLISGPGGVHALALARISC